MATLGTRSFSVVPTDKGDTLHSGWWPNVEDSGGDDPPSLDLEVVCTSKAQRDALLGAVTRATFHRSLGTRSWNGSLEHGPGPETLTIPEASGVPAVYTACLTRIVGLRGNTQGAHYRGTLTFVVLSEIA
jgi:hypothetical protein